jgi:soluble lytic murein transglycosylase
MTARRKARPLRTILTLAVLIAAMAWMVAEGGKIYIRKMYPLSFEQQIRAAAKEYLLDPHLVMAVIHTESKFDPDAQSRQGAQGLMQLMPDTAQWIAEKINLGEFELNDPDDNIRIGCWYLNYLLKRFDWRRDVALAAYNAGPSNVEKWLDNPDYSADGHALDEIPFAETRNYLTKVLDAYEKYAYLYPGGVT